MAARTVREKRRRFELSSGAARVVRTDAPRRTGPLFPRPGLGHAEGLAGKADRPRSIPPRRLSRDAAGLCERLPCRLVVLAGLRGGPGVCALQRHRALLDLSSACPTWRTCSSRSCPSRNLLAGAPTSLPKRRPDRRRINQFVSWSIVRAAIEHTETLLLFDRFPHRNAVMQRPHRGGEVRYLTDPMRPLWSFTQPPDPDYFALLGALCRMGNGLDESRIRSRGTGRPAPRRGAFAGRPGFADGRLRPRR